MVDSSTSYNVRIIDHGDGKFSVGFIHRFKKVGNKGGGEWVDGNRGKVKRQLV